MNRFKNNLNELVYSYGPGEIIVKENEPGDSLFMLINGHVAIRKPANSHEYLEIAQLQRGDIFGEMTVFTGHPAAQQFKASAKLISWKLSERP